jgi:hypothetical protein
MFEKLSVDKPMARLKHATSEGLKSKAYTIFLQKPCKVAQLRTKRG